MAPHDDDDDIMKMLQYSFTELAIQDNLRKSTRMSLPSESTVIEFNVVVKIVLSRISGSFDSHRQNIITFFGAPIVVIAKLWELILQNNEEEEQRKLIVNKEHLLWALHYMKQSPNLQVFCKTMKKNWQKAPTKKTVLKWIWFYVREIHALYDKVIVWEHRKTNDVGDDVLVSVDCIDCQFQQILIDHPTQPGKKTWNRALYSFKFKGPALRYEVAVSLRSNDIVWVNGPFMPGDWPDPEIFKINLLHELEPGERVEADNIYIGCAPDYVVCPECCTVREEALAMMKRVEGRHENMNKHLKNWKCMKGNFEVRGTPEERIDKHETLFYACAIIKQVALQMGVGELHQLF